MAPIRCAEYLGISIAALYRNALFAVANSFVVSGKRGNNYNHKAKTKET